MREESLLEKVEKVVDQAKETTEEFDAVVDCFYELYDLLKSRETVQAKALGQPSFEAKDLASSISSFAEWHWDGYHDRDEVTKAVVSEQLWSEVSKNVYSITGRHLATFSFSAEIPKCK